MSHHLIYQALLGTNQPLIEDVIQTPQAISKQKAQVSPNIWYKAPHVIKEMFLHLAILSAFIHEGQHYLPLQIRKCPLIHNIKLKLAP